MIQLQLTALFLASMMHSYLKEIIL